MRKIYKIIGGMLISGFLITGIGSGIVFAEYSTFEYGGEAVLEGSEYFTKTITYRMPEKKTMEERELQVMLNYPHTIVEDYSVSKDEALFIINYLSDNQKVNPRIEENTQLNSEDEPDSFIYIDCGYQYNDFRDIMRAKEPILSDLRNHKISDYQMDGVENIEIHLNPKADFGIKIN